MVVDRPKVTMDPDSPNSSILTLSMEKFLHRPSLTDVKAQKKQSLYSFG